jgi:hypothetical protein
MEGAKNVNDRKCIFLIDKTDQKDVMKKIEEYIRPVFVSASRAIEVIRKMN